MEEFKGQKILVVEDNAMSFKLYEAYFLSTNLQLIHAKDGNEALSLFQKDKDIELILMDIQLPYMSGIEVTRKIRELDIDVPIIATTANVFDNDKIACLEAGCNNFISKPINFPELFMVISKYLG